MKNFRIIKLSKKVIIFQLRISKHKLLEFQLEFNIWDIIKFNVEFFLKSISHWIFGFELYLGIINIIFSQKRTKNSIRITFMINCKVNTII